MNCVHMVPMKPLVAAKENNSRMNPIVAAKDKLHL